MLYEVITDLMSQEFFEENYRDSYLKVLNEVKDDYYKSEESYNFV